MEIEDIVDVFDETDEEADQLLDLSYIPQASVDKRHGGRHLRRSNALGPREIEEIMRDYELPEFGGRRESRHVKRDHRDKGGHIKWCLAAAATLYTAFVTTFALVFKMFTKAHASFHTLNQLHIKSANMNVEERNKVCRQITEGKKQGRKAIKKQCNVQHPIMTQYSYVPPCAVPHLDGALRREEIQEERLAPVSLAPEPQPQATYTLEQVKSLLDLERQRLQKL